jgi:hypothetical protein
MKNWKICILLSMLLLALSGTAWTGAKRSDSAA